jgi:hypothetical protein
MPRYRNLALVHSSGSYRDDEEDEADCPPYCYVDTHFDLLLKRYESATLARRGSASSA